MGIEIEFEDNSNVILSEFAEATDRVLDAIGIQAESYAKQELQNDPSRIDTGRLRNSISHATQGDSAYIGTNVEYGIYVHEGTRKMAPNRFLKNAVQRNAETFKQIAESEYKKG